MRRFVCIIVTLCICVSGLLCGCGGDDNPSMSLGSSIISLYTDICSNGELYIDNPNARLNFVDFASMKSAIICPSPNCSHSDYRSCPSFGMMNHPIIYGDRLYFFKESTEFSDDGAVDKTAVYSASPDGTGKRELKSTDGGILNHYDRAVLVGDVLYFCLTKSGYDQFGSSTQDKEVSLHSYSFAENRFTKCADIGKGFSAGNWLLGEFGGEIYVQFSYRETEPTPEEYLNPDLMPEFEHVLYKYSISDGSLTECMENISDIQNGWLITKDSDSTVLRSKDGKELVIPTGSDVTVVNGFAFDVADKAAYELSSGRKYSLNLRQEYCEIIYYIDESYIAKSLDSAGNNVYEKIPEADLIGEEVK